MSRRLFGLGCALAVVLVGAPSGAMASNSRQGDDDDGHGRHYIRRVGRSFHLRDKPFRVAGSSNYYLMYQSKAMVDAVLETAAASGFNTMRLWGSLDIGNQDGTNSIRGKANNVVYFQYWNGTEPAYNDGPDGLEHLDYVLYKARQLDLRLIIPFVNNWNDFGGMDQYVRWAGGQYHDDFYTDPTIRGWYKSWISHLLNRRNIYTGIKYKDDSTIMTWELANEPRCGAFGAYPRSSECNTDTLLSWADDVSAYIKRIDRQHLVSAGDEGFYCVPGSTDWTENCGEGVDTLALADLPHMDVMSFHLYPDGWGKDPAWGTEWIRRHIRDGRRIRERAMMGEFGLLDKATRNPVYKEWTDTVLENQGTGALYWILADKQDNGTLYPDYDGFTVYCPSPVCTTFKNFTKLLLGRGSFNIPPVADHDTATVEFDTGTTLPATANDVTWFGVPLKPSTLDLDPATPGQQRQFESAGGTFALETGGNVSFTPLSGFSGPTTAQYVVRDVLRRTSNPATLSVVVKADPNAALKLFSFETGTEGWAAASWQTPVPGVTAQSGDFATDGAFSLRTSASSGAWFGLNFPAPADFLAKTQLRLDLQTTATGTSTNLAIQVGNNYTWCQGDWGFVNAGTTTTVDFNLVAMTAACGVSDVHDVRAMWVWFSGGGPYYLDNVRAE